MHRPTKRPTTSGALIQTGSTKVWQIPFEYMYGVETGVSPGLLEKPQREDCEAHDLEMLTEQDPEQEDFERFHCNYYLGQSLFLELLESLGVEVFNERLRELYRLSLAAKDTGDTPGIAQVRQAFHDQADVVEKHWSGKLNAPENRPFDEGRYLTNHDLIQWEQYPTSTMATPSPSMESYWATQSCPAKLLSRQEKVGTKTL